jgi:hypothetical protein
MPPVTDPEECVHEVQRQVVVLDRGSALQLDEEIGDIHVERSGNGMEPTRREATDTPFVLMLLLVTDANQHRQLALCHSDKDSLHADPSPHMSIDIGRFDAPRGLLSGGGVVGRSVSNLRLAGCPPSQSCHGGLAHNEPWSRHNKPTHGRQIWRAPHLARSRQYFTVSLRTSECSARRFP